MAGYKKYNPNMVSSVEKNAFQLPLDRKVFQVPVGRHYHNPAISRLGSGKSLVAFVRGGHVKLTDGDLGMIIQALQFAASKTHDVNEKKIFMDIISKIATNGNPEEVKFNKQTAKEFVNNLAQIVQSTD